MGVPKFFAWLGQRYPCITEEIKDYQIPEFDNLYLDMNGIFHVCSHPDDYDPHFRISEEQIFLDIFHYIEVLFRLIRPKKLFFMAVDGVAPRAKMNQQRGRRFSSAKSAEISEKKALEKGEVLPSEERFDSNCITPGTKFMAKLEEQLKYFVVKKISTDKLWQIPTIVLSGQSVPGEGEHKIMDYLRELKAGPDWDPSSRHCLYGLDADLIILGMCTHETNFSLLREEVSFGKASQNKRTQNPETVNYTLLHLSLLRDYIDLEFQDLKTSLPFPYNLDAVIDDWVLMSFLVGNDFIPHLPNLHIAQNAFSILYKTYMEVLPTLDGYINESGFLNLRRFEKFIEKLAEFDLEWFSEVYCDMKYFESKTGRKLFQNDSEEKSEKPLGPPADDSLGALIRNSELEMFEFEGCEGEGWEALEDDSQRTDQFPDGTFSSEFSQHKAHYYINKMQLSSTNKEVLENEALGYVRGLQWILHYYYQGCPSWEWFYPNHYSPFISDIQGFSKKNITFQLGKPFFPFQQLLAVLPSASKKFLPEAFQNLMTSESSPIIDFYPNDFKSDLNGKRNDWEAVILIPFIDEKRLTDAMTPLYSTLTSDEVRRNSSGPMFILKYTPDSCGPYPAPEYFPEVKDSYVYIIAQGRQLSSTPSRPPNGPAPCPIVGRTILPGFPTLKKVPFKGRLEKAEVKVFQQASRNESMVLNVENTPALSAETPEALEQLMQKLQSHDYVFVSWPHLTPAKIFELKNLKHCVRGGRNDPLSKAECMEVKSKITSLEQWYLSRWGVRVEIKTLLYAHPLTGTKLVFESDGKASLKFMWSEELVAYPLETLVLPDKDFSFWVRGLDTSTTEVRTLEDYLKQDMTVFIIGPLYYGASAKVLSVAGGCLRVEVVHSEEPDLQTVYEAMKKSDVEYFHGNVAANKLGISSYLLSRITGSIFVQSPHTNSDKTNIGLSLKFNKSNKECVGFTLKSGNIWLYSSRTVELVRMYIEKFPDVFEYLAANSNCEIFFKDKIFANDPQGSKLNEIKSWLKTVDKGERRTIGSELLSPSAIEALEDLITNHSCQAHSVVTMKVKMHHIYVPTGAVSVMPPDSTAEYKLLDRVAFVRDSHDIPLGLKGTIIGFESEDSLKRKVQILDVLFDSEVVGGSKIAGSNRKNHYRLTKHVLINLSHSQHKQASNSHQNPPQKWSANKKPKENWRSSASEGTPFAPPPSLNMFLPSFSSKPETSTSGSVSDFFKACTYYQNDALRQLKQDLDNFPAPNNANPSFNALWEVMKNPNKGIANDQNYNHGGMIAGSNPTRILQNPHLTSPAPVDEQTEKLKKLLKLGNHSGGTPRSNTTDVMQQLQQLHLSQQQQSRLRMEPQTLLPWSCSHNNCCNALFDLCSSSNYLPPKYQFENKADGLVCRVRLEPKIGEGFQVAGLPAVSEAQARGSAACAAVDMLKKRLKETSLQREGEPKTNASVRRTQQLPNYEPAIGGSFSGVLNPSSSPMKSSQFVPLQALKAGKPVMEAEARGGRGPENKLVGPPQGVLAVGPRPPGPRPMMHPTTPSHPSLPSQSYQPSHPSQPYQQAQPYQPAQPHQSSQPPQQPQSSQQSQSSQDKSNHKEDKGRGRGRRTRIAARFQVPLT